MKILRTIYFAFKSLYLILLGRNINHKDYQAEYDLIAPTYHIWLNKMQKYTDEILKLDLFKKRDKLTLLDFACGTGYITEQLLNSLTETNISVFSVDISEKMINKAQERISDTRCNFIIQDGLDFLKKEESNKYDAIFCGYALPYFNHRKIIFHLNRILKDNGTIHIILNCKGTLQGVHKMVLETMREFPNYIEKIMKIVLELPKNERKFESWFRKYNYESIFLKTVNEEVYFSSPEDLYYWLKNTGAIAGTGKIFSESEEISEFIIKKVEENFCKNNKYTVNHKFIQGVFKKV
ncbi:MAG: class I SAM-dependent methyltransferase [Candidatus Heimdallarchaeaceae archaeon]